MKNQSSQQGFTLIELLVVIGVIAVLAAIVLIAINPAKQFREANDSQRRSNVNAILNAIGQYTVDTKGSLPGGIPTGSANADNIADGGADLCAALVPTYIPALPIDPTTSTDPGTDKDDEQISSSECGDAYDTGYEVYQDSGRVTVQAPSAQEAGDISVTR